MSRLLSLLLFLLVPVVSWGATVYVNGSGGSYTWGSSIPGSGVSATGDNTTGNGSRALPYATMTKAEQVAASSGDSIYVASATYNENDGSYGGFLPAKGNQWTADGTVIVRGLNSSFGSLFFSNSNGLTMTGFTFDGQSGGQCVSFGQLSSSVSNINLVNCTFLGGTDKFVFDDTGTFSNITVTNPTVTANSGRAIRGKAIATFSGGTWTIGGTATYFYNQEKAGSAAVIMGATITINAVSQFPFYFQANGNATITNNTITINPAFVPFQIFYDAAAIGAITFTGNTVTFAQTSTSASYYGALVLMNGTWAIDFENNTITSTSASQTKPIVYIVNQATPIVNGNNISSQGNINSITVSSTGTTVGAAQINNNIIRTIATTGGVIIAGADSPSAGVNGKLTGTSIQGNTIYGCLYYNPSSWTPGVVTVHSILAGQSNNFMIRKNMLIGSGGYGIVVKNSTATGGSYTAGGVFQNVIVNTVPYSSIITVGTDGLKIMNNTIYTSPTFNAVTWPYNPIFLTNYDANTYVSNATIENNIVYSNGTDGSGTYGDGSVVKIDTGNTTGLTLNYNNIYKPNLSAYLYTISGTVYANISAVRGAGYEANGVYGDPKFKDASAYNFRLATNAPAKQAGFNICTGADTPVTGCTGSGTGTYTDFAGRPTPRPGLNPSVGAYEYYGSPGGMNLLGVGQ